ncbi:MAG: nitroreductase family protein, partial [Firmicutes bacterium]|nr:nitroreductase family protein [Bacillota bacterium]
ILNSSTRQRRILAFAISASGRNCSCRTFLRRRMAAELGIGSCWVMWFDPEAVRREFNVPEDLVPVSLLPMGYPADGYQPSPKHSQIRPAEETVIYNKF